MHLFATREDLVPAIKAFEALKSVKYVTCGVYRSRVFPDYSSALDIPDLGKASHESAVACSRYLVLPKDAKVEVREMNRSVGGIGYFIDQLENPISIVFWPGGLFGAGVLLSGRVDTVSKSTEARSMLRAFESAIKKRFTKRAAFYVGAEALHLKEQGYRLTGAVQSPSELSLV
jgi:hypothetical protein